MPDITIIDSRPNVDVTYSGDNVTVDVSECNCLTDYNDLSVYAVGDGVTITGDGTTGNPFVAVGGGGGTESDPVFTAWLATNPLSAYAVAGHTHSFADITSKPTTLAGYGITDAYPLTGNPSGFLTSFIETDPIFSASAAAGITGTNITNWNAAHGWGNHASAGYATESYVNAQGFITSSALAPYLTSATAASTYQPILVSGTTIKTVNSTSILGSGNISVEPVITAGTTAQYWRGDKSWQTLDKTAVGLGSVENTALSTWAGSTNIITLGTIATGTWSATAIGATKGGTGLTTYATGDILYASAANTLSKLAAGTNGHVLTLAAGVPTWAAPSGGNSWSTTGNSGLSGAYPSTNFIGTTDNQNVIFKRNNAFIFGLYSTGIILGINTADNKYIEVSGSNTGDPATGYSYSGFGYYNTYSRYNYALVQNNNNKIFGIGIGGDGLTRIATGTSSGVSPAIYIKDAFGSNGNVGIGGSPVTGAKMAVVSTTSVFLPPVMTATNGSAIASVPKGGMCYITDTNGTFTSAGWWGYNGSTWKLICAQ